MQIIHSLLWGVATPGKLGSSCSQAFIFFHFRFVQVHFVFCQLYFMTLFPCLIKYYHIMFINIAPPPQGTVDGLQVWISQEIHPLFRGVATPAEDKPELQFIGTSFFRARFTSFHAHASLLIFFSFSVFFHSCCFHAQVFGKTLLHEFLISYSHTK